MTVRQNMGFALRLEHVGLPHGRAAVDLDAKLRVQTREKIADL
jgi:hypothetical protein